MRQLIITFAVLFISLTSCAQPVSDGPYLQVHNNSVTVTWLVNDTLHQRQMDTISAKSWLPEAFPGLFSARTRFAPKQAPHQIDLPENTPVAYLSDPHGQLEVFTTLLQNHQIIDNNLNWNFGHGHLVLVGDVFDRGPGVTEIFWLLYKWQQQAADAGGAVHMTLGNHELMVLQKDLRYLHTKYRRVDSLLSTDQSQLYDSTMLLGQWLRKQPVLLKLGNNLVVHAGVSPELVATGKDLSQLNARIHQTLDLSRDSIRSTPSLSLLYRSSGPFWYRGFFKDALTPHQADSLLAYFNVQHIIVGHTSFNSLNPVLNQKVIGVDASMKKGKSGEILLYKSGKWLRGTFAGEEFPLITND
ncbi:MAG: metallophosphoesterase [Bacteroidota bacterium]